MPEQPSIEPNVDMARRWAKGIFWAYGLIPVPLFIVLLLFPQSRNEAPLATWEAYLANAWLIGLAVLAYSQIKRRPESLSIKMAIVGALVMFGLVDLLFIIALADFYVINRGDDGQVAAFLGGLFLPIFTVVGWAVGTFIGWVIERLKGVAHKAASDR